MASQTKDRGIIIGVDIMDMSISWDCSIHVAQTSLNVEACSIMRAHRVRSL